MKVSEYIPLYGIFCNCEYLIKIDSKAMTVNELFEDHPDFELTDTHIRYLQFFDRASLQEALKDNYFTPLTTVQYLRDLFDEFRELGGDPLEWLFLTFENINLNPTNYKPELRGPIEKVLIEWIEIFNKQPFEKYKEQNAIKEAQQKAPVKKKESITTDNPPLTMEEKVNTAFRFMLGDDDRKHKEILRKEDFNNFIGWATYYFKNLKIPDISDPIKEVNTSKGNIIHSLKNFFKDEYPEKTYPDSLFELYRTAFYPFREDKLKNFLKQKEPPYYNLLVKKNN